MSTQTNPNQSLKEFIGEIEATDVRSYLDHRGLIAESDEAHKIKNRALDFYNGIDGAHYFQDESGQTFDCIPWNQYPTAKALGQEQLKPPPPSDESIYTIDQNETHIPPQLSPGRKDQCGREMYCESGTVALFRRPLFEFADSARYFSQKAPDDVHRHEYVYRDILNRGMGSFIHMCLPKLDLANFPNQVFSLSQLWCTAGKRSDRDNSFQSVEAGWHVNPAMHGDPYPRLFVFWTPDNYSTTAGSYAQAEPQARGFVPHTSSRWVPRMPFTHLSVPGDINRQKYALMTWQLGEGGWWLKIGSDSDPKEDEKNWVGHYPKAIFGKHGKLASSADHVAFGGETCCTLPKKKPHDPASPPLIFPAMGTGSLPTGEYNSDFGNVTYHRNLFYYRADTKADFKRESLLPNDLIWYESYGKNDKRYALRRDQDKEKITYYFFGGPGGPEPVLYTAPPGDRLTK